MDGGNTRREAGYVGKTLRTHPLAWDSVLEGLRCSFRLPPRVCRASGYYPIAARELAECDDMNRRRLTVVEGRVYTRVRR